MCQLISRGSREMKVRIHHSTRHAIGDPCIRFDTATSGSDTQTSAILDIPLSGVLRIYLYKSPIVDFHQPLGTPCHLPSMPMIQYPSGGKQDRKFFVG